MLQADSLPAEPQGKPKNTGVGNLSLLQRIFLTQESNRGLLLCRRILYQLSYQGSPKLKTTQMFINKSLKKHILVKLHNPRINHNPGCESWTIKKVEPQRTDTFELWSWRRLLRVPWAARRSNQSILKEMNIHCKD